MPAVQLIVHSDVGAVGQAVEQVVENTAVQVTEVDELVVEPAQAAFLVAYCVEHEVKQGVDQEVEHCAEQEVEQVGKFSA